MRLNRGQGGPFEREQKMFFVTRTRLAMPSLYWSKSVPASHWHRGCAQRELRISIETVAMALGAFFGYFKRKRNPKVTGRKSATGLCKL